MWNGLNMKNVACEKCFFAFGIYNLHNGLLYHIEETKKLLKSTVTLAVEIFKKLQMEFHSFILLKKG